MMYNRRRFSRSWLAVVALGALSPGRADEPADEKARAAEFATLAQRDAESYTFHSDATSGEFRLHPEPILKWSNPVVGSIHGNVYVWTDHGRPVAVGSIYQWYSPFRHKTHEFQSLAPDGFVMERDGVTVWSPAGPGVELKPLLDASPPAGTPAQRLRQMRDLSTRFTARQTDRKKVDRDMRLLAQPVYRYEGTEGDVIDGALFVFALGTDPEALLLIEARRVDGAPQWYYGLARMNSIHMRASDRGREVWNVPTMSWAEVADRHATYTTYRFNPVDPAEKPEGR
jgi:hypothetical protein